MSAGTRMQLLASVVLAAVVTACSSAEPESTRDCSQSQTRACECPDGRDGSQVCSADGYWKACTCGSCAVAPSCEGKACGADDGCGSACLVGSCPSGQRCAAGACAFGDCIPECSGKSCGAPDLCGGICPSGSCAQTGFSCNAGKCECKPICNTCGGDDTCGGKCSTGACDAGFKCSAAGCGVDPSSKWVITLTNGTVTSDSWDSFSNPDAMVCLWIGGSRYCTADAGDTMSPSWGCTFPPVTAFALTTGIEIEAFDNDRSGTGTCSEIVPSAPGEAICLRGSKQFTTANFKAKTWTAGCTGLSFNATLSPL